MSDKKLLIRDFARQEFDNNFSQQETPYQFPELLTFRDLWLETPSTVELETWRQSPKASLDQYQIVPLIKGFLAPLGSPLPFNRDDHTRIDPAYACFMDGILGYGIQYTHEDGAKELISLVTFLVDIKQRSLGILQMQGGNTKELFEPGKEMQSESPILGSVYARGATKDGRKALSRLTNGNQLLYELVLSLCRESDISRLGIQSAQFNRSEELRASRRGKEKYDKFARDQGHQYISGTGRYYWREVSNALK